MPISDLLAALGGGSVVPVPIPHDCQDGFTRAFWRRPEAYLDASVRAGMSTFEAISQAETQRGLARLETDLRTGRWHRRWGFLLDLEEKDLGYRIVVAES